MTAKGLLPRRFRSRSRATAASSVARQARWNPPTPLIARMSPLVSQRTDCRIPSSRRTGPGSNHTSGPHTGQALGSAWNRRDRGSSYSAAQATQSGNRAMVVRTRSYGVASITV